MKTQAQKLKYLQDRHNKYFAVVIVPSITKTHKELLKDPNGLPCPILLYTSDVYISQILRDVGIATSISQAKGAGWLIKAPKGFTDYYLDGLKQYPDTLGYLGVHPHRMTILNTL